MDSRQEQFTRQLLATQTRLRVFVRSAIHDRTAADDVLQAVNLVLCRKSDEFEPGTNFAAWAFAVARFEILKHRQRFARDRLVFDETVLELMAEATMIESEAISDRRLALRWCMQRLPEKSRLLLTRKYEKNESTATIADSLDRPMGSIRQTLYRLRLKLLDCIERSLEAGEATR